MRLHAALFVMSALSGCIAQESVVSTITEVDDSGDSDSIPSVETDTTGDTGEPVVTDPTYDTSVWNGTLRFDGDILGTPCSEQVTEVGRLLPEDHPHYTACVTCNAIYRLTPSADSACETGVLDIPLAQPTFRGVLFGDGFAMIYAFEDGQARLLDADASYAEGVLDFAYSESFAGSIVDVAGSVSFPEE